ncbi:MAG: hypothetical protein KDJ65_02840 [Anaerolineae bacterium]|nr:hypothetical protein [Anaerolineae bacterium]
MSTISRIYTSYGDALTFSRDKYTELYRSRARNARDFYETFFNKLIVPLAPRFNDAAARRHLHRHLERFFETDQIDFVAIDGTSKKIPFQDFIVFFACAYGAKGQINLSDETNKIRYQKWSLDKDVSMVTYIPIPFAEFADVADQDRRETFLVSDSDRVDLSTIDTRIMELAEIYLAYNLASSSVLESPKLIMLDRSPSSVLADVALQPETIPLLGYPYDRRRLTVEDALVALAHPFNPNLGIPSLKKFRQYWAVIAEFHHQRTKRLNLADFASQRGLTVADLSSAITYLTNKKFAYQEEGDSSWLVTDIDVRSSWDYVITLFEHICRRLFIEKDQTALMYEAEDEQGVTRLRWMSPDDIRFLIAVGIRALIEKCWERKILLTGVIKDSTSRYLTRNYLGVMKLLGQQGYPELNNLDVRLLPWTDRIFLELLPLADDELVSPWSTIEFDSTYMTLHGEENPNGQPIIAGVKQFIVAPERLFARSLAQFFLKREKPTPLAGHVVFIDRLVFPEWDTDALNRITIETPQLGHMQPLCYPTRDDMNIGQMLNMYLLDVLTRNHFPEVIGYPDPLHKADWGAKSVGERASKMIASSVHSFRAQPLSRTFRDIRDSFRR